MSKSSTNRRKLWNNTYLEKIKGGYALSHCKVYEFEREFYVKGDGHVYKNGRKLKPLKATA